MWSPYGRSPELAIERSALLLPGRHRIEVRAREVGRPETTDSTPVVLRPTLYSRVGMPAGPEARATDSKTVGVGVPGEPEERGCNCRVGGEGGALGGLLLVVVALLGLRARRAGLARLVLLLCLSPSAGCSCSGGDDDALEVPGSVRGGRGRARADRAVELDRGLRRSRGGRGVRGVTRRSGRGGARRGRRRRQLPRGRRPPSDPVPTFAPDGYRSGVTEEGPDVGAYTSIALHQGRALVELSRSHRAALAPGGRDRGRLAGERGGQRPDQRRGRGPVQLARDWRRRRSGHRVHGHRARGGRERGRSRGAAALRGGQRSAAERAGRLGGDRARRGSGVAAQACAARGTIRAQDGDGERCTAASDGCAEPCGDEEACVGDTCVATVPDPAGLRSADRDWPVRLARAPAGWFARGGLLRPHARRSRSADTAGRRVGEGRGRCRRGERHRHVRRCAG